MIHYNIALRYFLVMTLLLLFTGVWMFVLNTSLSIEGTGAYYAPKSFHGMLDTVSPHLFGMGLIIFILTHFFAILKGVKQENFRTFSLLFVLLMLLENLSGLFITEGGLIFSVIKLLSTLLFVVYTCVAMLKLLFFKL
jgi:hypothetical protein